MPIETTAFSYSVTATNAHGSQTAGPFFSTATPPVRVTGTVMYENDGAVVGATVNACLATGGLCYSAATTSGGDFSVDAVPGTTIVLTAYPLHENVGKIAPATTAPLVVPKTGFEGEALTMEDVEPPADLSLKGFEGSPDILNWQEKSDASTEGCVGGIDAVSVLGQNAATGAFESRLEFLGEAPEGSGTYSGVLAPLYPMHGPATIANSTFCPETSALAPFQGPTMGGNTVFVTGTGFTGVTQLDFGSASAVSYKVLSDEVIEAVAPAGTGTVPVTVFDAGGGVNGVDIDEYTYVGVGAITPTSGPTSGGTWVLITGAGLASATAVRFGDSYAPVRDVSASELEAESPPGTGTQDIIIETLYGTVTSESAATEFTYADGDGAVAAAEHRGPDTLRDTPRAPARSGLQRGRHRRVFRQGPVTASGSDMSHARLRPVVGVASASGVRPLDDPQSCDDSGMCSCSEVPVIGTANYATWATSDVSWYVRCHFPSIFETILASAKEQAECTKSEDDAVKDVVAAMQPFTNFVEGGVGTALAAQAVKLFKTNWMVSAVIAALAPLAKADFENTLKLLVDDAVAQAYEELYESGACKPPPPPRACPATNTEVRASRLSVAPATSGEDGCKKILIDPSGTVLDANGSPVSGATVSMFRSETWSGPFGLVSAEFPGIEPAVNPETTEPGGIFQWEVDSGFYEVQASAPGCTVPGNPSEPAAIIGPYPVPPPRVGLTITLACSGETSAPEPAVTSLSASSGRTVGGTSVTVLGTGFTPNSSVTFGSASASVTYVGPEDLQVVSPAGDGPVEVHVQTAGGTSANTSADTFFYGAPPTVTGLSVHEGPTSGGTRITVTGIEFSGATVVGFGGVPGESLVVKSSTEIEVTAPEGRRGTVAVIVTTPAGSSEQTPADEYTYLPVAPVCSPVSVSAPAEGAVTVPLSCSGQEVVYDAPTAPAHGSLSELNAPGGSVLYTPSAGYSGPDSFTYTAHNAGGTSNTATVTITVETIKPAITKEPQGTHVAAGAIASFTAEASGAPKPAVQWQRSTDRGASWSALSGAASTTVTVQSATVNESGYEYRAEFTNAGGHATSAPVKLTVTAALPALPELGRCVTLKGATGKYKTSACTTKSGGENTGKYEWESGPGTKAHFSSQNKTATFETTGKTKVKCSENRLTGEYTGPQTIALTVTFTGCEAHGAFNGKCQSPSAKPGEIVTGALEGQLGIIENAAKPTVGWVLEPALGDTVLSFECGLTAGSVTNAVITPVSSADKMTTKLSLKLKASRGKQEPEAFEAGLKNTLSLVTTSIDEQVGLTMSDSATSEEPLEIKAII